METPLVSVCMPAFNAAEFISEAIESVLQQTLTNWELVVVDNASVDGTSKILAKIQDSLQDSRISVIRNSVNLSMAQNWNVSLTHSRGVFLKLLCADDALVPDCLERQLSALEKHPSVVLASGARILIDRHGRRLFTRNAMGATQVYHGKDAIRRCLLAGTNIIGDPVNVLWRREAMKQAGTFDDRITYCTDMDYWLRLLGQGDLFFDSSPTGLYRIHGQAAATRLGSVVVDEILKVAQKQVRAGNVRVSPYEQLKIRLLSWLQNRIRQVLYKIFG